MKIGWVYVCGMYEVVISTKGCVACRMLKRQHKTLISVFNGGIFSFNQLLLCLFDVSSRTSFASSQSC